MICHDSACFLCSIPPDTISSITAGLPPPRNVLYGIGDTTALAKVVDTFVLYYPLRSVGGTSDNEDIGGETISGMLGIGPLC